jgi:ribonuclease T2
LSIYRPDNCDGSYEQYCAPQREVSNITEILAESAPSTLEYMKRYWKDWQGDDEGFWEHEFNKHGTCISTLEPDCYTDFNVRHDVIDYFKRSVGVFQALPSYQWLAEAGIVPSSTASYSLAQIQAVLRARHGQNVIINCNRNNEIKELWYHFNVKGSTQEGEFIPSPPVGSPSTCKATGIKYIPKDNTGAPGTTSTTSSSVPLPTGSPSQLSGTGRLFVSTDSSSSDGFLISGGTWYRGGGTPAPFTATPSSDGRTFTLATSKGRCAVQSDILTCSAAVSLSSAALFGWDGSYLTYRDSNAFYATAVPSGTTQGVVYTAPKAIRFRASWTQL